MSLPANAWDILGVTDCDDRTFTIQLVNYPDGDYVVQLGEDVVESVFDFESQTIVVTRPEGLEGGTYHIHVYLSGEWVGEADIEVCSPGELETDNDTPGGRTPGFWGNKNGQALISAADLQALRDLCLKNADGSDFDPSTKEAFASWLREGSATNMAYMLSVQLSATVLNIRHGFTDPAVQVDGTRNVTQLVVHANDLLCSDGHTPSGDPNRAEQERVKNILDQINNGESF